MKATYVPPQITPTSELDAMRALRDAVRSLTGEDPFAMQLAVLTAQCSLETGRWKSCWNQNWGNAKAGELYEGWFTAFRLNERISGKFVWFRPEGQEGPGRVIVGKTWDVPPGHPQCRMRAYLGPADGAAAHIRFLLGQRWAGAWLAAQRGDPHDFVVELRRRGYFTAELEPYARAVSSLSKGYLQGIVANNVLTEQQIFESTATEEVNGEPERSGMTDIDFTERTKELVESGMAQLNETFWTEEYVRIRDAYIRDKDNS